MSKKIVIALGGNALGKTVSEQAEVCKETAKAIADLICEGHQVIVCHGNGPQVGMIQKAMTALHNLSPKDYEVVPLYTCAAMSQGYIGFDLQKSLHNELRTRGVEKVVSTVMTQVEVDPEDPAFNNPTKPIGAYVSADEAEFLTRTRGFVYAEDAGRGVRRVVASPKPQKIVELEAIEKMVNDGQIVIACGGGGIPVVKEEDGSYVGIEAIIDKDFASAKLAQELKADMLIILTAVEKVAINWGTENQQWLDSMTIDEANQYIAEMQFAPGSMLPKVRAAMEFAQSGEGRTSLITLLEKAKEGINGQTGTIVRA